MNRKGIGQAVTYLAAFVVIFLAVGCGALRRTPRPPRDYALKGQVIQRLRSFDNTESAAFSADGKYVFISNAAELGMSDKGFHFIEHGGFISKLEIQPDGKLKMVNRKLIEGMTGPLGLAVLPKATKMFPAGTLFVCKGNLPMAEPNGARITDSARLNSELIAFDVNGKLLGAISWGRHSYLEQISGAPATQPNGMAFDQDGNLYVAETGMGGDSLIPPMETVPGVMMIPHGALDDLAAENTPKEKPLFIPIPGGPDGVAVCPTDQSIYVNTVGLAAGIEDPDKGATFRLQRKNFDAGACPMPIASGFGALDGLTFLPNGTRLETQVLHHPHYIMATLPGKKAMRVALEPDVKFSACADIAVRQMPDGSYLLVVPQLSPLAPNIMRDEVVVAKLPKEFGTSPVRKPRPKKKPAPAKKKPKVKKAEPKKPAPKPKPKKVEVKAVPAKAKPKAVEPKKPEPEPEKPKPKKVETKAAPMKETPKAKPIEPPKPEPKKVETKAAPAKEKPKAKKAEPEEKEDEKPFLFFFGKKAKKKREARKKKEQEKKPFFFFFGGSSKKRTEPESPKPEPKKTEPEPKTSQPTAQGSKSSAEPGKKDSVLRDTEPMQIKPRREESRPILRQPTPAAPSKVPPKPEEKKNDEDKK